MQPIHDHGTGAKPHLKMKGDDHLSPAAQRDQLVISAHPVLIALVRLLAREAAAECFAAFCQSLPFPENVNGSES